MARGVCEECEVETDNLVGLFVPHLCVTCLDVIRLNQIKINKICKICKKPYCDCYC